MDNMNSITPGSPGVNVPLLRKAVEWVEAQAQLPELEREWRQSSWVMTEDTRINWGVGIRGCGTAYCVAGWIAAQEVPELAYASSATVDGVDLFTADVAGKLLGLEPVPCPCGCGISAMEHSPLFEANNTAEDVRRIAEELAGERL